MIISEKQVMQLIGNTYTLMAICDCTGMVREDIINAVIKNGSKITDLLSDITKQQFEELKEVE